MLYRSATSIDPASSNFNINVPSGVVDGDMLRLIVLGDVSGTAVPTPSGWTSETIPVQSNTMTIRAFYRIASLEPTSYNITSTGGAIDHAWMIAGNPNGGVSQRDGFSHNFADVATASITATAVTVQAGGLAIVVFGHDASATVATPPAGYTLISASNAGGLSTGAAYYKETSGSESPGITWNSPDQLNVVLMADSSPGGGGGATINDHNLRVVGRGVGSGVGRGLRFHRQPAIGMRRAA